MTCRETGEFADETQKCIKCFHLIISILQRCGKLGGSVEKEMGCGNSQIFCDVGLR